MRSSDEQFARLESLNDFQTYYDSLSAADLVAESHERLLTQGLYEMGVIGMAMAKGGELNEC